MATRILPGCGGDCGQEAPEKRSATDCTALCSSTPPLFKEAMKDFDAVVETYPSNVHGLYNRAVCQAMLGNLRLAEEDLNRAIAMNPGDAMLYDQRGKNFAAMGRPRMAMKDMATSLLL